MDEESLNALLSYATQLSSVEEHHGLPVPCHDAELEEPSVFLDDKLTWNKIKRTISLVATPSISLTMGHLQGITQHLHRFPKEFTMRELFGSIIQRLYSQIESFEMDFSREPEQWPVGLLSEVLALCPTRIRVTGIDSHQRLNHVCQYLLPFTDSLHLQGTIQTDEGIVSSIIAWHKHKGNTIFMYICSYCEDAELSAFDLPIDDLRCYVLRSDNVSICQRYLNSLIRSVRRISLLNGEYGNTASLDLSTVVTTGTEVRSDIAVVINATCVLQSLDLSSNGLLQSNIQCRCDSLHLRGSLSSDDDLQARIERLRAIIAWTNCSFFNPNGDLLQQLLSSCILPSVRCLPAPLEKLDLPQEARRDLSMLQGVRRCFPNTLWLESEDPMTALSNYYSMVVRPLNTTDIKWAFQAARLAGTQQRLVELLHFVCGLHMSRLELPRAVVTHLVRACLIATQT
eukprot:TRINITY_DN10654_c0_g1_i1.p1 TRINITY_DN10654_c0_g1~~TRINITY_DN10654_c0_g1_i1.p1  ORF type:complete len:456 (+),score=55.82 TRINITY_DN10654_c0_g1_i1:87-1454(+)